MAQLLHACVLRLGGAWQVDDGPLEWAAVEKWLQELMEGPGQGVLSRFKGME